MLGIMQESILEVRITDLSRGGAGVARDFSGRVVFVPFTAPGDLARVRVVEANKRYAQAELLELLESSDLRVKPLCPAFGRCGGCQWQHLSYQLQWKTKVSGILHALSRVGMECQKPVEEFPAETVFEYRNRVQLRGFKNQMGFYAARSHDVIPLERCEIARPEINEVWDRVRVEGSALRRPYKVEVEVLPSGEVRTAWNAKHAAGGFRQVHDQQNEKLQAWVKRAFSGQKGVLLDLFGGSGNLSLGLADQMEEVHCVDVGTPDVNANPSFRFHRSPVAPWLLEIAKNASFRADFAILDPPREGLGSDFHSIASSVENLGVKRIALVGCDPDAWARDLSRFVRREWSLDSVGVLDFFPQTPHVESLAVLSRSRT